MIAKTDHHKQSCLQNHKQPPGISIAMPAWKKTVSVDAVNTNRKNSTDFRTRKEPKVEVGKDENT